MSNHGVFVYFKKIEICFVWRVLWFGDWSPLKTTHSRKTLLNSICLNTIHNPLDAMSPVKKLRFWLNQRITRLLLVLKMHFVMLNVVHVNPIVAPVSARLQARLSLPCESFPHNHHMLQRHHPIAQQSFTQRLARHLAQYLFTRHQHRDPCSSNMGLVRQPFFDQEMATLSATIDDTIHFKNKKWSIILCVLQP